MSDIFREVDEEVRRERLLQLWDRYGILVIAVAVAVVLGVAGWRGYQWWEAKQAAEASAAYDAAASLSTQGKHQEAEAAFAKLSQNGTASYQTLSRLREAAELAARDAKAAASLYDKIAADTAVPAALRDVAALRAGLILADAASYEEVRQRLEPLTGDGRAFRHSARAALALAAWRANDMSALKRWTDMVLADAESPANTRGQAEMLMALTASSRKS